MSQPQNLFPLSYQGVRAPHPPNVIVKNFDPSPTTSNNVAIGDFWINFNPLSPLTAKLWVLLGLSGGVANWVEIVASAGDILSITGNLGGAVNPVAGNIDIVTANTTVKFIGNNSPANITQDFGLSSLLLGSPGTFLAGALRNVGVGFGALADLSTGADNTAVGYGALTTASGAHNNNTAIGSLSMTALTTGANNTAVGSDTLSTNTTGTSNTAVGVNALTLFTGSNAVAVGSNALAANSSGAFNTAVGTSAGAAVTTGDSNTALGFEALQDVVTGSNNTSIGALSLNSTTGSDNTALGFSALGTVTTGSGNIAIGYEAGLNYVGAESANIVIGNSGTAAEDFTIRIGTQGTQTKAFIAGIAGVSLATPTSNVVIDNSTGQLAVGSGTSDNSPLDVSDNTASAVSPAELNLIKTRAGGPITSGDRLGELTFAGYDSASNPIKAASIVSDNSGTIGATRVAGNLQFYTHPDAPGAPILRMVVKPTGEVSILDPDSGVALTVTGQVSVGGDAGAGTASNVDLTNVTAAAGGGAGAIALQAGGVGVTQAGWLKIYVNGVVSYLPFYQ